MPWMQRRHRPQPRGPYTATGSPTSSPVTPSPSAATQPAFSCPRVNGIGHGSSVVSMSIRWRSEWHAPAPPTRTSTSPGPGDGSAGVAQLGLVRAGDELESEHRPPRTCAADAQSYFPLLFASLTGRTTPPAATPRCGARYVRRGRSVLLPALVRFAHGPHYSTGGDPSLRRTIRAPRSLSPWGLCGRSSRRCARRSRRGCGR